MKHTLLSILLLATTALAGELVLKDDFTAPKLDQRRAMRGEWKFSDNTATCTQDDELFKKYQNHGPILFYDLAYTDGVIETAFQADAAVKSVVFTCNAEGGHLFRIVFGPKGASIRAFPPESKEHASIALATETALTLKPGQWTPLRVELRGTQISVRCGDFSKTYEHASFARPKVNFSLGHAFGTLSVKPVFALK